MCVCVIIGAKIQESEEVYRKKEEDLRASKEVNNNERYRNYTKRKRAFRYVQNKGAYIPTSQLDGNENNDFSTRTSTSSTTQPSHVIEEHVLPVSNNWYHVSKSQQEKKEQRSFTAHMRYTAEKKTSNQPKKEEIY